MVEQVRIEYCHYTFRGMAHCTYCKVEGHNSPGPIWSQENIFVPGSGVVYILPGGIVHYVEAHSYLPPKDFVDAALRCPNLYSPEYKDALRTSNVGIEPPLRDRAQFSAWLATFPQQRKT